MGMKKRSPYLIWKLSSRNSCLRLHLGQSLALDNFHGVIGGHGLRCNRADNRIILLQNFIYCNLVEFHDNSLMVDDFC